MNNRLKRYRVEDGAFMRYLTAFDRWPTHLAVPVNIVGPPSDAQLETVWYDQSMRCFVALVSHSSFPEVPQGEHPPMDADHWLHVEVAYLERGEDKAYRLHGQSPPDVDSRIRELESALSQFLDAYDDGGMQWIARTYDHANKLIGRESQR